MESDRLEQFTNDAYRAIGRYVVAFSQLMFNMRTIVAGDWKAILRCSLS